MSPELEKEVIEETEQIEQEKEVTEESQEDTETTDVVEEDGSESTQETQEDSDDGYEAEVLQQYGLKHKSVKELAEEFKKREAEYESVKREAEFNKLFLEKKEPKEEAAQSPFGIAPKKKAEQTVGAFPERPANTYLDELRKSGRLTKELDEQYRGVATIIDDSVTPLFEQTQQFMYQAATVITNLQKKLQDMTWGTFNHPQKGKVQRDLLDKLMAAQGLDNYDDAMNFYLLKTNPSLLNQVVNQAKDEGKKEGLKTLKRLRTNRRGSPAPTVNVGKYIDRNGNVDEEKLLADFGGDRLKVAAFLDKYAK